MSLFFTSDTHFNHANIILPTYCNRPFKNVTEMNEKMIENWNRVVSKEDTVWHLGDFGFGNIDNVVDRLNGIINIILGSHDKSIWSCRERFDKITPMETINIGKRYITLCHYAMRVWPRSHYNTWHLYGHCLDLNTEILTVDGWKKRSELQDTDKLLTLNLNTNILEYNFIERIIDYKNYTGLVYSLSSKGFDFRVTSNHVMLDVTRNTKNIKYRKFLANKLDNINKRTFIRAGYLKEPHGLNISDNMLKLVIWITADGSLCNSDLVRIRLLKSRKIKVLRELLKSLKISFRELVQNNSSISFNFSLPKQLNNYRFKPLDNKIKFLTRDQVEVILNEYVKTDGKKVGKTYIIYTSKKEEADLLQEVCLKNGFTATVSKREKVKSDKVKRKPRYEIFVTNRQTSIVTHIKDNLKIEKVKNEHFWCVRTCNKTIVIRRNGKPLIVGNSHGGLSNTKCDPWGKSFDVGVDCHDFTPISLEQVGLIMSKLPDNPNLVKRR